MTPVKNITSKEHNYYYMCILWHPISTSINT